MQDAGTEQFVTPGSKNDDELAELALDSDGQPIPESHRGNLTSSRWLADWM